ncbi:MAG: metallopeptidase TldD-related protein [Bacillota bacterium]|nr:metallopeptidase TldD-related protein [Bacillota bacterium]
MKTEFITIRNIETTAKIVGTKVDAVRIKDIIKKGVRVYDNEKIGVSGAIGDIPDNVLVEKAVENLSTGIEYPYDLEKELVDHRKYSELSMSGEDLLEVTEEILEELRKNYDQFLFSEKISVKEMIVQMRNSEGLDLEYKDAWFELGLILKENSSANLFDGHIQYFGRTFDKQKFWDFNKGYLDAYDKKAELPAGEKLPVFVMDDSELNGFLNKSLNGERYANGSSVLSGKLGEQLFNEKINFGQNYDSKMTFEPFFDNEGVVLENDRLSLIGKGKFINVFTDKKTAATYDLPHTGAADGAYDGVPNLTMTQLKFETDSADLKTAMNGQMGIFVVVSAGGDFTPDGSFAAPVQVGFLFDGERFIGKLPEFTMRSNLWTMLGEDYIGTFDNPFYIGENSQVHGYYMTIVR